MAVNGKATRKDIVEESIFNVGRDFAKSLEPGIQSTLEWKDAMMQLKQAALEYSEVEKNFKISDGRKEFLKFKQEEERLRKLTADALKKEQDALKAVEKTKQEALNTEKKINDAEVRKQKTKAKTIKLSEKERFELRILNRGKREAAVISSKLSTEYEKQSVILTQLRRRYKDVALRLGENSKEALRLQGRITKLDAALKKVDANVGQFQRSVGNYSKAMSAAGNAARQLASAMGLVGGAFLVVQVIRDAIRVIREFEKSNATLTAILQKSRSETQGLAQDAIRLGASTVKTASEVTELQIAYARLGFSQSEILEATEATIQGSIALNGQLAETAELTGAVINTFDNFSTIDTPIILDKLALSTAKSALSFSTLKTSLPIVAGAANAAGISFNRLLALLGKLADSGIDASMSANALKNIFIESKAEGLDYGQILEKIKNSQDKLTASNDAFGKRAAVSAAVLSSNIEKTNELNDALEGAAGTAKRMADEELNTLDGALQLLRSAWEGFILGIDDSTNSASRLKDIVKTLAENLGSSLSTIALVVKAYLGYVAITKLAAIQTALMTRQVALSRLVALSSAKGINVATLAWVRFTAVLKANALGIIVTAVAALIFILDKYNKTLEESVKETNKQTQAFLDSRVEQERQSKTLGDLADRYDELTSKTELNKDEQKELDDILIKLSKTVPGAITQIDKYGNAITLNTDKIRDFNKANDELNSQREKQLLQENQKELEALARQQANLNKRLQEGETFYVKGVGAVASYNGQLKRQVFLNDRSGQSLVGVNELTAAQIETIQAAIRVNGENIDAKKEFIETLTAEGRANIAARAETTAKAEADAKAAREAAALAGAKEVELLKVQELKTNIKELRQEQDTLTKADKARAAEILKLIGVYEDEIDAILGVSKVNKSAEKAEKEREQRRKKLASDAFALTKFSLDTEIDAQKKIASSEKSSFEEREAAIAERARLELELAEETAKRKLGLTEEFSGEESSFLLNAGFAAAEAQKKLTDEQLLILKEYEEKKKEIQGTQEAGEDSVEVDRIKTQATQEKAIIEKKLQDEIAAENDAFVKREGIYEELENATEKREKRIADIKRKYALEGLNAQVEVIEELLENEELSAQKRAEYEIKLAKIKGQISEISAQQFISDNDSVVDSEREKTEKILSLSSELADAINSLSDSIFEGRVQKIDDEIAANDAKYERLLEADNLSASQQKEIEKAREKDREALEAKKRKEQRKQAIIGKAIAALNIGLITAQAVISALAPPPIGLGPVAGIPLAVVTGAIGAVQLAAVLAKPIPKYFKGTENHPGGLAEVGEIRPEVIREPNKAPYIVDRPTIMDLPAGTKVTPSVEEYERIFRQSTLYNVAQNNEKVKQHENRMAIYNTTNFDTRKLEGEVVEMKKEIRRLGGRPIVFDGTIINEQPVTEY